MGGGGTDVCCGPQGNSLALSWKYLAGHPLWKERGRPDVPCFSFQL